MKRCVSPIGCVVKWTSSCFAFSSKTPFLRRQNLGILNQSMEGTRPQVQAKDQWKQMGSEEKKVLVHEEMKRMNKLPANSSYATHRVRVLNKILQLLSVQRTTTEDQELELLFAGLSL